MYAEYLVPSQGWSIAGLTNASGMIEFDYVPVNIQATFSATKTGYVTLSDSTQYPTPGTYNVRYYIDEINGPTPTPTGYPSPTPTVLPGGLTRTYFASVTADTGARIYGIDINLKDVSNNSWKNSSADADGFLYIDTLPSDSIYVFLHDPTHNYLDHSETDLTDIITGDGWTYDVPMYKNLSAPNGTGSVNFYVYVADQYGNPLTTASVVFCEKYSCQPIQHVGTGATILYNVTGGDLVQATASAPGYVTATAQKTVTTLDTFDSMEIKLYPPVTLTPTYSVTPSPLPTSYPTNIPTTIPGGGNGTYGGFWGPFYTGFTAMGATPGELPVLVAVFLIVFFAIIGAAATAFNPMGLEIGAMLGAVISVSAGFINLVFVIVMIFWLAFRYYMMGR